MKKIAASLLLLALAVLPLQAQSKRSAFDAAVSTARIHSFTEILRNSGLPIESLRDGDVTLLVPVDISFYKLTPAQYQALLSGEDKALAVKYIEAHLVKGTYSLKQLGEKPVKTVGGIELKVVAGTGGAPATINGLPVFQADITGTNGAVHFIQGFLFQP